jgi:hypothetical protein
MAINRKTVNISTGEIKVRHAGLDPATLCDGDNPCAPRISVSTCLEVEYTFSSCHHCREPGIVSRLRPAVMENFAAVVIIAKTNGPRA